jgi:hypothetical protein
MSVRRVWLLVLVLAAVGAWVSLPRLVDGQGLPVGGRAPEITGGPWIGGPPLTLEGLRGRVVLVEFWTYG